MAHSVDGSVAICTSVVEGVGGHSNEWTRSVSVWIQDLTYVMILKDFKKDMTIEKPKNYNRNEFICSYDSGECFNRDYKLWSKEKLISYGKLPNNKYMINWPINGNDYYLNSIEMTAQERLLSYDRAKQKSLRFGKE